MLYEKYEQRVRRKFFIIKQIRRFRVLLISLASVAFLLTSAYNMTKGMVYGLDVPRQITFTEELSITSNAVFSDVSYVYREIGEEQWTHVKPFRAGDYQVKIITKQSFGRINHKIVDFTITPKVIEVNLQEEVTYGYLPTIDAHLFEGDTIDYINFIYLDAVGSDVAIDIASYRVIDTQGNDVTLSYQFQLNPNYLAITSREITVKLVNALHSYDGETFTSNQVDIIKGSLVEGHTVEVTATGSQKSVGLSTNDFESIVIWDGDNDVTGNYEITLEPGIIEVIERPLTIKTGSSETVFDGGNLTNTNYEIIEGSLITGHRLVITEFSTITNVGTIQNNLSFRVLDDFDVDVTDNYALNVDYGYLVVTQRPITINTHSAQKIYDNTPLNQLMYDMTEGTLVNGHTLHIIDHEAITNVSVTQNVLTFEIRDSERNNVTSNYLVDYNYGTLEVTKRPLTIETLSAMKVYDGTPLYNLDYVISSGSLVSGQLIELIDNTVITLVGSKANVLNMKIIGSGGSDVTDNYDITYEYKTLEITPRLIEITTLGASKVYDGYALSNLNYQIIQGSLAENHVVSIIASTSLIEVGQVDNLLTIEIHDETGRNVTDNYDIIMHYEPLEITKRQISVLTHGASKIFDGLKLSSESFELISGSLASDHLAQVKSSVSMTFVGVIDNELLIEIFDNNGNDVTHNYEISYYYEVLEVYQRSITVKPSDQVKMYDGVSLTSNSVEILSSLGLVTGHTLEINTLGSQTNVGVSHNTISTLTIWYGNIDVTSNYDITLLEGYLEVTPRKITIQTIDTEKVYDGTYLSNTNFEMLIGSFVQGHYIEFIQYSKIKNVGLDTNHLLIEIFDLEDNNVTSNYEITYQYGTLKVTPRPIAIKTFDDIKMYDGTPLYNSGYNIKQGSLAINQTLIIESYPSIINVGKIQNGFVFDIYNHEGLIVTDNYQIIVELGELEITPRIIRITTDSSTKVYDGTYLSNINYTITDGSLVMTHSIYISSYQSIIDVGRIANTFGFVIFDDEENDLSFNYQIIQQSGVLEITPRLLTITTYSSTKIYDGTHLYNTGYTIISGTIAPSQFIDIIDYTMFKDVGIRVNQLTFAVYNQYGHDVTHNYVITQISGALEITPRYITISTPSDTKVYDGTPLYNLSIIITEGDLAPLQSIVISNYTNITNVGSITNQLDLIVYDQFGVDVTHNYVITFTEGMLEVTTRYIHIHTNSEVKIYDGIPLFNLDFDIISGSLAPAQSVNILEYAQLTNVGKISNQLTIEIVDSLGQVTSDNYTITMTYGELEVVPRPITVLTGSAEKIYDDTPLTNSNTFVTVSYLVSGHAIRINSMSEIINVGVIDNVLTVDIIDGEGNIMTSNYAITFEEGSLEIHPRPITVKTGHARKMVDLHPLFNHDFEIIKGSLVVNHTIEIIDYTDITSIGIKDNSLTFEIYNAFGASVTSNYIITLEEGVLEITPITLFISTPSATKQYDGAPLSNDYYEITKGSLLNNHYVSVTVTGTITHLGKAFNTFEFVILDENDHDVSAYYAVYKNYGILEIISERIPLIIRSNSDSMNYNGTALSNPNWQLVKGSLMSNHILEIEVSGVITNPGQVLNYFTVVIRDQFGFDVTDTYYDILPVYGSLIVFDESSNGNNTEASYPIINEESLSNPLIENPLFTIHASGTDTVYLRDKSYGDYKKTGFESPTIYHPTFGFNPLQLSIFAIKNHLSSHQLEFKALEQGLSYFLPYYALNGYHHNLNDVYLIHEYSVGYTVDYIPVNHVVYTMYSLEGTVYSSYELEYRAFVHEHYLTLPKETKAAMLAIASNNGIYQDNQHLIEDIQAFIVSSGNYYRSFRSIPDNMDMAVYFLEHMREGDAQHFAMSATVMYRSLGIPARYVTGYKVEAQSNQWVEVFNHHAHAWVEVYIDGFGWVMIEVTPSLNQTTEKAFIEETNRCTVPVNCEEYELISITSENASKMYDGNALSNDAYYYEGNLKEGHSLEVEFLSSITQVGKIRNEFTARIIDTFGNDVTGTYRVRKNYGLLEVVPNNQLPIIEIQLYDLKRVYNGQPLKHHATDYWIPSGNLPHGYTLNFEIIGSKINPGIIQSSINPQSIRLYDEFHIDVTNQFNFVLYEGQIEVLRRQLTISAFSAEKLYDGEPLTSNVFFITQGSLAQGDNIFVTVQGEQTEVGDSPNRIQDIQIFNALGEEVTTHYTIKTINGKLTVYEE